MAGSAFLMWPVGCLQDLVRLGRPGFERHPWCSALDQSFSPSLVRMCPGMSSSLNVRPVALAQLEVKERGSV